MSTMDNALTALSSAMADAVASAGASVVTVNARRHIGASGVVWQSGGIIVTTDHGVERDEAITVGLPSGETVDAVLVGRDASTDLAVLRLAGGDYGVAVASTTPTTDVKVGHLALAIGRPGGVGLAASMGVVGSVDGQWRTPRGGVIDALIRADITMYPGFSGGPLAAADGSVVGINTSGLARGMGLTIPAQTVTRVVQALLARGRMSRGYLGVGMQAVALSESLRGSLNIAQSKGLMLVNVEAHSPAEQAGLLLGDILIGIDQTTIEDTGEIQRFLDPDSVGKALEVRIVRGGALTTVAVTVGERQ